MTQFADTSHHNGVDLKAYMQAGHERIVLKATEDTGFVDPTFSARWTGAGALGLARVAYHFLRNQSPGDKQFAHFNSVVPPLTAFDLLCLDVEDTDTPGDAATQTIAFVKSAVAAGYHNGLIYTYKRYADTRHITAGMLPAGWRQLWLADYTASQADSDIELPNGWARSQVLARQFTANATVPGITSPCDYNRVIKDWLPTTPGDDGMATWSDQDSANLATVADWVQRTYRSGFAAQNTDGTLDPTHEAVSVRGVNEALGAVNGHLDAMHMLLTQAVALLQVLAGPISTPPPAPMPPVSETP